MNRTALSCTSIASLALLGSAALFAGPLDPPPGPVSPQYKTLTEVEPRIAINAVNTPGDADSLFKITQPGSYYLTGNITGVAGKHGIEIAAHGVTLDLMGFDLSGGPGATLDGVSVTGEDRRNIAVVNGSVRNWGQEGVDLSTADTSNCRVERVLATGNAGHGIMAGSNGAIITCSALQNAGRGIFAGNGGTVAQCSATDNAGDGISTSFGCTISGCSAIGSGGHGINAGVGCTITGCTANFNDLNGINAFDNCTISNCLSRRNGGDGIDALAGSTITGCSALGNTLNGIRIDSNCRVAGNACDGNGAGPGLFSGIFTLGDRNRIEGNHVTNSDFGIGAGGAGHLIIGNYAGGNTTNYSLPASGSFIGTIVGNNVGLNEAANSNINISN